MEEIQENSTTKGVAQNIGCEEYDSSFIVVDNFKVPGRLLFQCFTFLEPKELYPFRLVNREWKKIIEGKDFVERLHHSMTKEIEAMEKERDDKIFTEEERNMAYYMLHAGDIVSILMDVYIIKCFSAGPAAAVIPPFVFGAPIAVPLFAIIPFLRIAYRLIKHMCSSKDIVDRFNDNVMEEYAKMIQDLQEKYKEWNFSDAEKVVASIQQQAFGEYYKLVTDSKKFRFLSTKKRFKPVTGYIAYHTKIEGWKMTSVTYTIIVADFTGTNTKYHIIERKFSDFKLLHDKLLQKAKNGPINDEPSSPTSVFMPLSDSSGLTSLSSYSEISQTPILADSNDFENIYVNISKGDHKKHGDNENNGNLHTEDKVYNTRNDNDDDDDNIKNDDNVNDQNTYSDYIENNNYSHKFYKLYAFWTNSFPTRSSVFCNLSLEYATVEVKRRVDFFNYYLQKVLPLLYHQHDEVKAFYNQDRKPYI